MKNTTITFDLIMHRVYANHVIYYVHIICCVEQYTANYTIIVYIIICIYIFIPAIFLSFQMLHSLLYFNSHVERLNFIIISVSK